jgi:exosortase E/protease (VPEID-CTERM system)
VGADQLGEARKFSGVLLLGLLALVFLAECLTLTVSFESPTASLDDPWYVRVAAFAPDFVRAGTAAFGALLLLLAPRLKTAVCYGQQNMKNHVWQPWLILHLLAFSALYLFLTSASRDGEHISKSTLALCEGLGVAVMVFGALTLAPLCDWRVFIWAERYALAIATTAGIAIWLGGALAQTYWEPLASALFFLAGFMLRLLYPHVFADPSHLVLGTPRFVVRIAPQCSGYEGIGLVVVFLVIYLWMFRSRIRFPQAFLLFPIGALVIWIANVLRIVALIVVGSSYSPTLASGGFHSQAGWISFIVLALAIVAVTNRMHFFALERKQDEKNNPVVMALLVPFLVWLGSITLDAAFSEGFDHWYPVQILAVAVALLWYRHIYWRWEWNCSWLSVCVGILVFVFWIVSERIMIHGNDATIAANIAGMDQRWATLWLGFRVVGSVLVIPFVEELAFRGYLLSRLAAAEFEVIGRRRFSWAAFLLSSAAFGAMHERWFAGAGAGMAYALAFYRHGRLGDAIVAHVTTNGLIALSVLMFGAWSLWS